MTGWEDHVDEVVSSAALLDSDPAANLVNGAGLPASPFRSDRWPGVTAERPREQWVRKMVLGGSDQVVAVALHEDLWIAFDAEGCAVREAWTAAAPVPGTVRCRSRTVS